MHVLSRTVFPNVLANMETPKHRRPNLNWKLDALDSKLRKLTLRFAPLAHIAAPLAAHEQFYQDVVFPPEL